MRAVWVAAVLMATVVLMAAGKDREKRFMFINPTAPTLMALLLTIPMSILIPTLRPEAGRSFDSFSLANDEVLPDDLLWEPAYEEPLLRLDAYFDHLELPLMSCRERLLCEMAASPESFIPIGEAFMKELRQIYGPVETSSRSLMWRYMTAAREGFAAHADRCAVIYPGCTLPHHRIINMSVLKVWKYIASKLHLQLY